MPRKIVQVITAVDNTRRVFSAVQKRMGTLAATFAGLGAAISAVGITEFVRRQSAAAAEIGNLSKQLRISTEALSQYQFVAEQSGVQFDTLVDVFQEIADRTSDAARNGGEAAEAFDDLGISAQALLNVPLEQKFEILVRAFNELENSEDRVRIAAQLFGDEGTKVLRIVDKQVSGIRKLRQESDDLGQTLNSLDVSRAAAVSQAFNRLGAIFSGLARQLSFELLPVFESLAATLRERLVPAFRGFLETFGLIESQARQVELLRQKIEGTEKSIARLQEISKNGALGLSKEELSGVNRALEAQQAALAKMQRSMALLKGDTSALNEEIKKQDALYKSVLGTTTEATKKQISQIQRYINGLQRQADLLGLNSIELVEYEAATKGASAAQFALAKSIQEEIDAFEAINKVEEENKRLFERSEELVKEYRIELEELGEAYRRAVDPTIRYREEVEKINELVAAGLLTPAEAIDSIAEAAKRANPAIDEIEKNLEKLKPLSEELGPILSSSFEDALVEGEKLRDVIDALGKDILKLVTRRLVTRPLADALGGLLEGFSATNFGGLFGRQFGGPVSPGQPYVVGERGVPEIFVPSTQGRIETTAPGNTINVIVQGVQDAASFVRNQAQVARAANMALLQAQAI